MLDQGIHEKLRTACENARIVFWEDASSEFAGDVETLDLEGVEVAVVANNEISLKRRVPRTGYGGCLLRS